MKYILIALLFAPCLTGCKHPAATTALVVDPATAGSITGTIAFTGEAPARLPIDMSADPACTLSDAKNSTEQVVVTDHRLANVYLYLKSGIPSSAAPASAPPVVLDQKGCRYAPHVVALQQGGKVEFRNSDPTMHNIHTIDAASGNPQVDVSEMPMGQPHTETFATAQTMLAVRCNNHPWMSAFINVAPNPYFAISAADGTFSIRNLPPGTYTLAAVHETLGEQDIQVTVAPRASALSNFSFAAK